jgi:hypothetical protein
MPCPHFSAANAECLLQQDPDSEGDETHLPVVTDSVDPDWCLGPGRGYRECPVFKRFLSEIVP